MLSKKIIGDAGYGDYYGHSLGHGVGIDIHELPNLGRTSNVLEDGGVRLEDYGIVTKDGFKPFTKSSHDLVVIDC